MPCLNHIHRLLKLVEIGVANSSWTFQKKKIKHVVIPRKVIEKKASKTFNILRDQGITPKEFLTLMLNSMLGLIRHNAFTHNNYDVGVKVLL